MPRSVASDQGPPRSSAQRAAAPPANRGSVHMRLGGGGRAAGCSVHLTMEMCHVHHSVITEGVPPMWRHPPVPAGDAVGGVHHAALLVGWRAGWAKAERGLQGLPTARASSACTGLPMRPGQGIQGSGQGGRSPQIRKRQPSGEMAEPPAWPAAGPARAGVRQRFRKRRRPGVLLGHMQSSAQASRGASVGLCLSTMGAAPTWPAHALLVPPLDGVAAAQAKRLVVVPARGVGEEDLVGWGPSHLESPGARHGLLHCRRQPRPHPGRPGRAPGGAGRQRRVAVLVQIDRPAAAWQ